MSRPPYFADTTIVYYRLAGHARLAEAVREKAAGVGIALSNFVRGEFIRGFIVGLIELYAVIKEEANVQNGIYVFNAEMGQRPRMLGNALQSVTGWLGGQEDWQDVPKTLRRLGEYVRGRLFLLDAEFPTRTRDLLKCDYGVLSFPQDTYDERQVLEFYAECEQIRAGPTCDQCEFRRLQQAKLAAEGIDLHGAGQQEKYKAHKGYIGQIKTIDKALRSKKAGPSCWYCDRLGDPLIALSAPEGMAILTGDQQSFPALGEILGKQIVIIPSLQQLRQQPDRPRS